MEAEAAEGAQWGNAAGSAVGDAGLRAEGPRYPPPAGARGGAALPLRVGRLAAQTRSSESGTQKRAPKSLRRDWRYLSGLGWLPECPWLVVLPGASSDAETKGAKLGRVRAREMGARSCVLMSSLFPRAGGRGRMGGRSPNYQTMRFLSHLAYSFSSFLT